MLRPRRDRHHGRQGHGDGGDRQDEREQHRLDQRIPTEQRDEQHQGDSRPRVVRMKKLPMRSTACWKCTTEPE